MSSDPSSRDPWANPESPESKLLCIPDDIPFPANIQSILEESRKRSSNPTILSWKEVVCAGPDSSDSTVEKQKPKEEDDASRSESLKQRSVNQPKRSNISPHSLSPEDTKRFFEILESTYK
ncbi:hypothetical protein XPA_008883 [Xanthoria parietina]